MASLVGFSIQHHHQSVALFHGYTETFLQSPLVGCRNDQLINHHFDVMVLVAVQFHSVKYLPQLAVHTHIEVALLAYLLEKFLVVPFTAAYNRCKQVGFLSGVTGQDQIQNLLFGVLDHLLAR